MVWYSKPRRTGLTLPVTDDAGFLTDFKTDFGLSRTDENGLSVIVPWLSDEVTFAEVAKAVLTGYFHPVLRKKLSVEIADETGNLLTIDADKIKLVIDALPADLAASLKPIIAMAEASLNLTERIILAAPNSANAPKWSGECIPEAIREQIHTRLEAGELVALHVPMQCRRKGEPGVDCHFDIFLQKDSSAADAQPIYIREGIIVTDVRPRRTSGIRAMVIIDKGPLGTFLGDSENPSHTQWQAELVRDKYSFHRATIDYVVQSVPQIFSILSQQQKKPETSLLIDLFSIPTEEPGAKTKHKKQKKKDGGETEPTDIDIPKTLKRWIIDKRENGFVVRNGDPGALRPAMLAIKVAYGVRRGSPFAKYNAADFRIGLGGIECSPTGCDIVEFDENWMLVRVDQDEFEIAVTGFDTSHRDLHVDVKSKDEESEQDSQQEEVPYAAAS